MDLKKIRAHSDNPYNDRADVLAKEGRLLAFPTSINHDHIPSQTVTISWDNTIPLDTNIRKCVGKIIDYKRIDNHLNHQDLTDILDFTKNHVINWELSSRFFNHNNYNDSTSSTHSKNTSWKIKTSTNTLPTLDILQRNYPTLINNETTCLLCRTTIETNEHIWKCDALMPYIRTCFISLSQIAQDILNKDADKLNLCITDSIKYSSTFCWAFNTDLPMSDDALLLLRSYVTEDLYKSFWIHFNHHKSAAKAVLKFMALSTDRIKSHVWNVRFQAWKQWKRQHNITKSSFKRYSQDRTNRGISSRSSRNSYRGYTCPQMDSFRNYYNRVDLLFIILASSNFLHSGFIFQQLRNCLTAEVSIFFFSSWFF